ncbi:hypothetical protein RRG08_014517 [Elysia crispata]|uniref:Uncharacterized protein n=1 Tax=Elysia crispata TaxID=231223 RepID=A0AAE1AW76_9GAST|nr:hypothetical protein RRG08_014517 [Elysia crispata]
MPSCPGSLSPREQRPDVDLDSRHYRVCLLVNALLLLRRRSSVKSPDSCMAAHTLFYLGMLGLRKNK